MLTLKRFCRVVEGGHGPLHLQLSVLTADIRIGSDEYYGVRFHSLLSSFLSHLRMKQRNGISVKLECHIQFYPTGFIFDSYLLHC